MKAMENLIKLLNEKIEEREQLIKKNRKEGMKDSAFHNESVIEGILIALEEIEKTHTTINIQINLL